MGFGGGGSHVLRLVLPEMDTVGAGERFPGESGLAALGGAHPEFMRGYRRGWELASGGGEPFSAEEFRALGLGGGAVRGEGEKRGAREFRVGLNAGYAAYPAG